MALPSDVSNATVDTAAAAVPAPYGPLTRVTDLDALGINPDSEVVIEFTTDGSAPAMGEVFTVRMSYSELTNTAIRDRILEYTAGVANNVLSLIDRIDTVNTAAAALTAPYTEANYATLIGLLRSNFPEIWAYGA